MQQDVVHPETLVVDLDGTLLRSDILYETFWSSIAHDWRSPFLASMALFKGRAALKRYLALSARLEITTLPYDADVIAYIKAWKADGGRTALVTASDQTIAQAIAEHLELFDEVHGSDGTRNLKGKEKAAFLQERFGTAEFAYMADAPADLAVWKQAAMAITINASKSLRREAELVATNVEHLSTTSNSAKPYVMALRPHQWLKNTLVFTPMLAAHQLDVGTMSLALLAFISFSLIASSVYVLNDLFDLTADRAHPRKRNRPFASGSIPISRGVWMAGTLVLLGTVFALSVGPVFFLLMLGYYLLTTAYSLYLKRQMIIDICVLACLYTIRIIVGGVATDIPLSIWLLAFSIFFFFSLAAIKRQAELVDNTKRGQLEATGRGYHVDDLPIISMIGIGAGYVSVLVMALYVNSPNVIELYTAPNALWGICAILLFWITRAVMVAHRGNMNDDPVIYATKDRMSQACFVVI